MHCRHKGVGGAEKPCVGLVLNLEDLTTILPGLGAEGGEGMEFMRRKENPKFNGILLPGLLTCISCCLN